MFRGDYEPVVIPKLAPLAWLFEQSTGAAGRLVHGPSVSVRDRGFFEGCAAVESRDGLADAVEVFGSGMIHDGERWTVVTPSHTLECVYLYLHRDGWSVSNSLAFLATRHRLVPPGALDYGETFSTIGLGIDRYDRTLFRTDRGRVERVCFDNLELRPDGTHRRVRKPMPPEFPDYGSYVAYLLGVLRSSFEDAARAVPGSPYRPLTTCSTGYDSTCAASLASDCGCTDAITLRTVRGGRPDSGRPIGERLGLRVHELDRAPIGELPFERLAPFFATGTGGEDASFETFGRSVERRVVLTGFHGDRIWSPRYGANSALVRTDASGCSLQEFRLQRDFFHMPVPMVGARRHAEIRAISRSPDLAPYRLGTRYDRPIPRRIAEERGVDRGSFGHEKKAASTFIASEAGRVESIDPKELETLVPRSWSATLDRLPEARARWEARRRLVKRVRRVPVVGSIVRRLVSPQWSMYGHAHPDASLRFAAALAAVGRRYSEALVDAPGWDGAAVSEPRPPAARDR